MRQTAIICDTGALLDYLVAAAPDHRAFRAAIDGARARYIPGLVLAEVDYFLRGERRAMRSLLGGRRAAYIGGLAAATAAAGAAGAIVLVSRSRRRNVRLAG